MKRLPRRLLPLLLLICAAALAASFEETLRESGRLGTSFSCPTFQFTDSGMALDNPTCNPYLDTAAVLLSGTAMLGNDKAVAQPTL